MTQQTEGIKATRLAAIEQSDGSLQVTLVIAPTCKAAFFNLFPTLETPLLLFGSTPTAAAVKPETQRIAPEGTDMNGPMGAGESEQLIALFRHPPFQSFVARQVPNEGKEADQHARDWLRAAAEVGAAGYADTDTQLRVQGIVQQYVEWHAQTYGASEKPLPW